MAGALGIGWLTRVPTSAAGPDDALVRLSWRLRGVRVEECRARTPEELEALAPHMRTPEVCVGENAAYALEVELDGREVARDTVRPAGVRVDRPVYVVLDLPVAPGRHRVEVGFEALLPEGFEAGGEVAELELEQEIDVGPAEIALITLDETGRRLEVRGH
jgi:hypothetical protein